MESLRSQVIPEYPVVNILPCLDPFIMGYKDRARYRSSKHDKMIFDRSGNGTSTILVDGRIVGIWDVEEPFVKIFYLTPVEKAVRKKIRSKVSDMGKFVAEKPLQIKMCDSMVPLPQRTAGSFMSPLKGC
jgi:hypothetical protein